MDGPLNPRFTVGLESEEAISRSQRLGVFDQIDVTGHEQIVYGFDRVSGLRAIIAIHSTALGPALGGTRFYPYAGETEALTDVLRLSVGMTYKAAAAGLDLGGGKAVIIGDPARDKSERLFRSYGRFVASLNGRYITAEDVGTTAEDMELIRRETPWALGTSVAEGGSGDPSPATARGILASLRAVLRFLPGQPPLEGRRIAIQGVGKVGYALARLLVEERVEVVASDSNDASLDRAVTDLGVKAVSQDDIFSIDCDVFAPCALGAVLNQATIPRLACLAVVGSANNQLAVREDADRLAERGILYAPDFVVNAGGLINVYEELRGYSKARAMHRVDGLEAATQRVLELARDHQVTPLVAAERLAEARLGGIGDLRRIHLPG
jgi:leucine dehydrogenase